MAVATRYCPMPPRQSSTSMATSSPRRPCAKEALRKGAPTDSPLTADERRLLVYVEKEESLRNYVASLQACKTAAEVGQVVATMCENESRIDEERIVTKAFIEILIPFMTGVDSGKGIDNIRNYINNAWAERKRAIRNR